MTYTLTTDIDTRLATKSEIKQFAEEHGCILSKFKALESNHLVTFSSNNLDYIQELTDQLQLSHSKIVSL
jgi:hypothetical protein